MKKTIRRLLVMFTLMITVGIGATFSFLSYQTNSLTNSFTSNRNIRIELKEPSWDGYQFGEIITGTPGDSVKPGHENDSTLGINQAKAYLPADTINKNPTIKNSSEADSAYIAFKLVFTNNGGNSITRAQFESMYGKLDIASGFEEIISSDKSSLFIYNLALDIDKSATLFTKVVINSDIALVNDRLPSFAIEATGYAVQGNIDAAVAKTELLALTK